MFRPLCWLILLSSVSLAQAPCSHQIVGTDLFGDGWNGASVDVFVNGSPVVTGFEVSSQFAVRRFPASSGDSITTVFHPGMFDDEVEYRIVGGQCLELASDGPSPSTGLVASGDCVNPGLDCPPPPPANDDCANSTPVGPGLTSFDTLGASTDGLALDAMVCDLGAFGDEQIHDDVWFCFTAPSVGPWRFTTLGLAGFDTRLALYSDCGSAMPSEAVGCNDNDVFPPQPPFESDMTVQLTPGQSYKLRVGVTQGTDPASGMVSILESIPVGPGIDECTGDGGNQAGCTACPCGNEVAQGSVAGCTNSSGTGATLLSFRSASVSASDLLMRMTGAPSSSFGVLTSADSLAPTNMANPCFGFDSGILSTSFDGLRCVVASTQRHGGRAVDALGQVGFSNAGWGPPDGPAGGIPASAGFAAGETRHFQVVYRELPTAVCGRGLNTTQALSVTFSF